MQHIMQPDVNIHQFYDNLFFWHSSNNPDPATSWVALSIPSQQSNVSFATFSIASTFILVTSTWQRATLEFLASFT